MSELADEAADLVVRADQQQVQREGFVAEDDPQVEADPVFVQVFAKPANAKMEVRLAERRGQDRNRFFNYFLNGSWKRVE